MGELSPKVTERARTLTKKSRRSDSIALTKSLPIAAWRLPGDGLALSVIAARCHLSQRERLWHVGPLPTERLRPEYGAKGRALLQRAAASEQAHLVTLPLP